MVEVSYPSQSLSQAAITVPVFSDLEIQNLAERYGTPSYVIDEETLRQKAAILEQAYSEFIGHTMIAYSVKSNFNPAVLRVFISEGILFDITSIGELEFYLRAGGDPENAIYTSITEEEDEYKSVLMNGVRKIVVSSYNGLLNLISSTRYIGVIALALVRVNPEVGVKAVVSASYVNGKFGVPFYSHTVDSAENLIRKIMISETLTFEGIHFHLGSQIEDPNCFIHALDKMEIFVEKMKYEFPDFTMGIMDVGGGMPVNYGTTVPSPMEIGKIISDRLNIMSKNLDLTFTLIVESGRFLTAESSILISKVVNSKAHNGGKFIIVDAGYHLLLDAALLHQEYPQEVIPRSTLDDNSQISVVGRLCDTLDTFPSSSNSNLAGAENGKLLVFRNTGAYSLVFNMPFHCQTKPIVLMRRINGNVEVVRKGETIEDLFEREGGNIRLSSSRT